MKKLILGAALLSVSAIVMADIDRHVYFSVLGGTQDFHNSKDSDNGPIMSNELDESAVIAAELGFMITDQSALQLSYSKLNPDDVPGFGDEDLIMQSLDYMYYLKTDSDGGPFLRFGVGQYVFESEVAGGGWVESDIARVGVGFEQSLSDSWSLRGEFGMIRDMTTNRYDTNMMFGFTVNFGGGSTRVEEIPVVKPIAAPKVSANTRQDADNDGIFDDLDQCPATLAGVSVDPRGCELDSDGDGVVNSKDACPSTPAGARVDKNGCRVMLEQTVRMTLDVKFKNNSSQLEPEFKSDIVRLAKFMTEYPDTKVVVEGHSDSVGKDAYNLWLSEKRAQTVAQELISVYGVAQDRVTAKGFGETQPVADNSTAQGRAKNRRVEGVIEATVVKPQ